MQHPPRPAITLPHAHIDGAHLRLAPACRALVDQFAVGHREVSARGAGDGTDRQRLDSMFDVSLTCRLRSPEFSLRSAASSFSSDDDVSSQAAPVGNAAAGIDGRLIDWSSTIRHSPASQRDARP